MTPADVIVGRILDSLKQGTAPWKKPWTAGEPQSWDRRRAYRGINALVLGFSPYSCPFWATVKGLNLKGHRVLAGEHGTPIAFWKSLSRTDDEGKEFTFPLLRYYTVFNLEQTTVPKETWGTNSQEKNSLAECEAVVAGYPDCPAIQGGTRAYYAPTIDTVVVPVLQSFDTAEHYYSTLFHELVHSTGHSRRINRHLDCTFGSDPYSREELVAEVGAAMLCGRVGIEGATLDNSAAYCQSWLRKLSNDPKLVISAASAAQRAVDWITDSTVNSSPDNS